MKIRPSSMLCDKIWQFMCSLLMLIRLLPDPILKSRIKTLCMKCYLEIIRLNFCSIKPFWEFPGGPVVRTPCFHYRGPGLDPWSGNQDSKRYVVSKQTTTTTKKTTPFPWFYQHFWKGSVSLYFSICCQVKLWEAILKCSVLFFQ